MGDGPRANIRTPWAVTDQTPASSAELRADMRAEIAALKRQRDDSNNTAMHHLATRVEALTEALRKIARDKTVAVSMGVEQYPTWRDHTASMMEIALTALAEPGKEDGR